MLYSKEDALKLATPIAEAETINLPSDIIPWEDVPKLRQMWGIEATRSLMGDPGPDIEEFDKEVCFRDGHRMIARVFRPRHQPSASLPLLVHYFGGGWVMGNYLQGTLELRRLVVAFNLIAIALPYRLAPENKFPIPQQDAYDGLKWVIENLQGLEFDAKQGFILSGLSAGGQLAAVCAQQWLHEGKTPPITGMYLHVPWILAQSQVPDHYREYYNSPYQEEMKDAPALNNHTYKLLDKYLEPDYKSEWHSPFMAASHAGMPRTYFQVSGRDPLRDHALIYEDALRSAGVETRLDVYPGLCHGFAYLLPTIPQAADFQEDQIKGIAFLLGRDKANPKSALH